MAGGFAADLLHQAVQKAQQAALGTPGIRSVRPGRVWVRLPAFQILAFDGRLSGSLFPVLTELTWGLDSFPFSKISGVCSVGPPGVPRLSLKPAARDPVRVPVVSEAVAGVIGSAFPFSCCPGRGLASRRSHSAEMTGLSTQRLTTPVSMRQLAPASTPAIWDCTFVWSCPSYKGWRPPQRSRPASRPWCWCTGSACPVIDLRRPRRPWFGAWQ